MPVFGLFKRDKHKPQPQSYTPYKQSKSSDGEADAASIIETVESSYLHSPSSPGSPLAHSIANNVYGNSPLAPSASSSKIRLGFRRKKSSNFVHVEKDDIPPVLPPIPRPPYSPSAHSEPDIERIRPPAKGALFSAYGDPQGAFSTRSLPNSRLPLHSRNNSRDAASADNLNSPEAPPPRPQSAKKSGLFAWAQRDRKKSQPSSSRPPERPPPRPSLDLNNVSASSSQGYNSDSFNLKSFRHVGPTDHPPELPLPRPPSALSMLDLPPARPRGNSVASDSSQRISVAAFRDAARRNNSPSPSVPRPPSRTELSSSRLDVSSSRPSMGLRPDMAGGSTSSLKPSPVRSSALRTASSDGSSSASESESEDSEDEDEGTLRPKRGDTVTARSPRSPNSPFKAANSSTEMGQRMRVPAPGPARVARTTLGHGELDVRRGEVRSADLLTLKKSNLSASALQSNAATDRPSTMMALGSSGTCISLCAV